MSLDHHDHVKVPAIVTTFDHSDASCESIFFIPSRNYEDEKDDEDEKNDLYYDHQDLVFVPRHEDPLLHERDASILDLVDDGDHDLGEVDAQGLSSTGYSVEMTQMWHSLDGRRARHMRSDWYMPPREEKY